MKNCIFIHFMGLLCLFVLTVLPTSCIASIQLIGTMSPDFDASQMSYIDNNGMFLLSNDSSFAFGFKPTQDATLYSLVIIHPKTSIIVWTANRGNPVANSDRFMFNKNGSVNLQSGGNLIWAPNIDNKPVSLIKLLNSGNLVLLGSDNTTLWQSFSHPTDTLLSSQEFTRQMKLESNPHPNKNNLTYFLEIDSGDLNLYAKYKTPQVYWSMSKDTRKIINKGGGVISSVKMVGKSWNFYDDDKELLWQFLFSSRSNAVNSTWIAVLDNNGFISFVDLGTGSMKAVSPVKIPSDPCRTPEPCEAYETCSSNKCQCPSGLVSRSCHINISSPCENENNPLQLISAGYGLTYFALEFVQPSSKTNLNDCKASCVGNCSCLALFFDNSSSNCYLFDTVGSFLSDTSSKYSAYVKVSTNEDGVGQKGSNSKHLGIVIGLVFLSLVIVLVMIYGGYMYHIRRKNLLVSPPEESEEDHFLETLSGMPVRYSYKDLQDATNNFAVKLGQGGFGSVYEGTLPDGTRLAVKKLERIGQGRKEFRAEVSIIGSIHHVHLVRLKGFCAEGNHRLLAYELMSNGSLDKWIFKKDQGNTNDVVLDWETRFNIAVGTAKGLAYLHEDCDVKIVHCDIKPENVLLDDHFEAKVSDFGLAKLMSREQSQVFTTLRGTRGYLAPEWITNYAISEKSDVYSYGMVLLEIIGGRKNYDPQQPSGKSHFPAYAFKMMEEGRIEEILDSSLKYAPNNESVQTAIMVALWCIQEDMAMRPSMAKVVQMLEGVCSFTQPPTSSLRGARLFLSSFRSTLSEDEAVAHASSRPYDNDYLSAVRLSGPR